ncbi:uncharacterized protein BDR25DRAFT_39659 [Lindgomyces ingoldianus]|uniref:Uncharacterized protein n=1 Tax=Lindgomyces ingoldianus TaxID=673940 RepID=A0ACB6QSC0_9PLEO|nr:uncharacterized protein BDR25DRAFT_39659 [Lindgomyces ingoldianus]KAF2469796.1 hypothetical protein BDR25DRAFT_39659 [Lindgomyces ingoldianus]
MPASPSPQTPRNPSRQKKDGTPSNRKEQTSASPSPLRTMKPADFGKAIGIDKPANVKDKIRKWQIDLEGDDAAPENLVPSALADTNPAPLPKLQPTPKGTPLDEKPSLRPAHTPSKSTDELPERPKSAKKPVHNKLDDDLRIASAPKKRVVSDSHWRTKKSPPKDGATRPSPKQLPTAWVRPAVRRTETSEAKVSTPSRPEPKPLLLFTTRPTGPRPRSAKRRRPSRPSSSGNEERPSSSGSGSSKGARSGDDGLASPTSPTSANKVENVPRRRRRRRRGATSPRVSLSTEDGDPVKRKSMRKSDALSADDASGEIPDERKSPHFQPSFNEDGREKRRSHHRREHTLTSPEDLPRDALSSGRRRSHRRSHPYDSEFEITTLSHKPTIPETPPKPLGSRLEAWLNTTPDPFVDADSRTRRPSKESISTLELSHRKPEKKDASETIEVTNAPLEDALERKSGSRRRTRTRSLSFKLDTEALNDKQLLAPSTDHTETSSVKKDEEIAPSLTLRRRGAKRTQQSPTKDRAISSPLCESTVLDEDIASSAPPSSSVEAPTMALEKLSLRTKPENPAMRRVFPSTGKRLSTIASVETFATKMQAAAPSETVGSEPVESVEPVDVVTEPNKTANEAPALESEDHFNADTLNTLSRRSTKRRLASHADLISVLSMPTSRAGTKSIMSARSIRTNRSRLATATTSDIMSELASDETKYMRELRTLVDGVIPVLLSCVLSKSDSAVAAGLFSPSASKADPNNVTKPIIDMGISLERLKSLHRRVPKDDPDTFLSWAQSAQRVYFDYINCWRMGFQDVVVSLAPADEDPSSSTPAKVTDGTEDSGAWDEGLPQNAEGYVVNGDGERVDVAYMLKRPLVRLKYLAKSIRGINHVKPSEKAENMSSVFQELVDAARKRSNDERARLEDEAAANIDPTRARDPRSLAPLTGVRIDQTRCVRARDYFDLHLIHSSGQEVDCRVELLLRDNAQGTGSGGDVLLCEVDGTGRWLFLPPIQLGRISARNGDVKGEIIVMIRGYHSDGKEWSEVFSLQSDYEQAGFEWVQMLGLNPIPPQLEELRQTHSLVNKTPRPTSSDATSSLVSTATGSTPPHKSRSPSPHEIQIPIGEQASAASKRWGFETPERASRSSEASPTTPPSSDDLRLSKKVAASPISLSSPVDPRLRAEDGVRISTPIHASHYDDSQLERTPRSLDEAMMMAGSGSPISLKRTRAKRLSKNSSSSPTCSRPSRQIVLDDPSGEPKQSRKLSKRHRSEQPHTSPASLVSQSSKGFSVWMPTSEAEYSSDSDEEFPVKGKIREEPKRLEMHRRASSVPSMDLPIIPKIRKTSQPSTPAREPFKEESSEAKEPPASAPAKLKKTVPEPVTEGAEKPEDEDKPPPVPPHRSPSPATPVTLKGSNTPYFTPSLPGYKTRRRSSSPLKHEYEPSTATESSTESEEEVSAEEDDPLTEESSDDELEDDVPTPLMPIGQAKQFPKVSPPASIYTLPNGTITPSQSASNTPYRAVPKSSGQASKTIASIFSWSDAGKWDSLHPDECSIVVTPGKIEVFEITAAHSKPFLADGDEIIQPGGRAPLIALELTPLVPIRKGTAIDITIRSPPTADSRIRSGNNIMLRSRNPAECADLYAMINHARINNPTYIALQNARGPYGQTSWAEAMDRQNAARSTAGSSSSWLAGTLGRRSSYRKSSTRAASISAATESSVGTMNTAFKSALNRFSFGKNGRFNIRGSTLGSRSTNSFDSGSNGSGSGTNTPPNLEPGRAPGAPAGITNTKCRLYERESFTTKWRDQGAARLTIMLPDPSAPQTTMRQGQGSPGVRNPTLEKRILVMGKTKGETLLDVTLGESCFERVARTGIAVSVWEDVVGPNGQIGTVGAVGGVSGARARVYMIQMKSEREAAYSFSLLGKLRY